MKKEKFGLLIFVVLFSFGCGKTWQYKGVTYNSYHETLEAQKNDSNKAENQIIPSEKVFKGTAKIILPSLSTTRKHGITFGILNGLLSPEAERQFLVSNIQESFMTLARSLRKKNLFKSTRIEQRDDTVAPELSGEDYLIWLEVKEPNSFIWYLKSKNIEKHKIHTSSSVDELERANVWIESIVNILERNSIEIDTSKNPTNLGVTQALEILKKGNHFKEMGQWDSAIAKYNQALALSRELKDDELIVIALNNIGIAFNSRGQYDKAIDYFKQVLETNRKLGREDGIAIGLNNIGEVYRSWGQYNKAVEHYQQALTINRKLGIESEIAIDLNNIGYTYTSLGQYDKAIEYLQQALEINRKLGIESGIAIGLGNIGLTYKSWGQYNKAIEFHQQALEIDRKLGREDGIAIGLNNIGAVYKSWGQYNKAVEHFQQALTISRKLGREDGVAMGLNNIGDTYTSLGQYNKAIEFHQQALEINRKLGIENGIAASLSNIGVVYDAWGQHDKSLEYYQQALEINRKLGAEARVVSNLGNIGGVFYIQKQFSSAIIQLLKTMELKEKLRETATGNARRDYLASQIGTYRLLVASYLSNNEPANAFGVMEQSRSRLLAERLGRGDSEISVASIKSVQDEMGDASAILSYANSNWSKISLVVVARSSIHGQQIPAEEALGAILQKHEAAILTMLGNQREIKVVNKDSGQHLPRADKKSTLKKTINFYRKLLTNPSPENDETLREVAMALYDLLVKPIEPQLKGKKEIIIIPDGVLGFLPFETLIAPDGQYLVEKYAITYAQSMTVQQLIKNRKHEGTRKPMLAFGGAVYDEVSYKAEMVTNENQLKFIKNKTFLAMASKRSTGEAYASLGIGQLTNLPGTLEEVNAIAKIVENSDIISGKDVTESKIKSMSDSGELSQYKVLHFATHGMTVPEFPELSSIVLSQFKGGQGKEDGYLRMGEIAKLKLNADFVNLSACETGLGKLYEGEGVVGLTQSFLIAGARGLSASLWNVSDTSTAMFMVGVYQLVEQKGMSYSQAINEMKLAFIRGQVSVDTFEPNRGITVSSVDKAKSGKLSHPFYWAPFVYYGRN